MATGKDVQQVAAGAVTRIKNEIAKLRERTEDNVIESIAQRLEALAGDLDNAATVELEKVENLGKQLTAAEAQMIADLKNRRTSTTATDQASTPPKAAAPTKPEEKATEQPAPNQN